MMSTKLFVGNIPRNCNSQSLRTLFESVGRVSECDVVKDYAFVHYVNPLDAERALKFLDGTNFQGCNLRIQVSHSKVRSRPGMGDKDVCYRCGKEGHWSKDCHLERETRGAFLSRDDDRKRESNMKQLSGHMYIEPRISTQQPQQQQQQPQQQQQQQQQLLLSQQQQQLLTERFSLYERKSEMPITFSGFSLEIPTQATFQSSIYSREFATAPVDNRTPNFNGSTNLLFQSSSNPLFTPAANHSYSDASQAAFSAAAVNIRYPVPSNNTYQTSTGIIGFESTNPILSSLHSNRFLTGSTNLVFPQADTIGRTSTEFYAQRTPVFGMEINGGIDITSYLDTRRY